MKKQDIVRLIECHQNGDDSGFSQQAIEIAKEFDANGDHRIGQYIMHLISGVGIFVPQAMPCSEDEEDDKELNFLTRCRQTADDILLPECVLDDLKGAARAVVRNMGFSKLLFTGAPGTGKTQAAYAFAKLLDRRLYTVNFSTIVDSKLGQTNRNIAALFAEINQLSSPDKAAVLFDEIDALALNRISQQDLREMGRAVSALLKGLDEMNSSILLIATTNLINMMDQALVRRFDYVLNFDRYTKEDLITIAQQRLDKYLQQARIKYRNARLFKKILSITEKLPNPGELNNLLKSAVAFSDPDHEQDYFKRIYLGLLGKPQISLDQLKAQGFSVRESEILSGIPKSSIARSTQRTD